MAYKISRHHYAICHTFHKADMASWGSNLVSGSNLLRSISICLPHPRKFIWIHKYGPKMSQISGNPIDCSTMVSGGLSLERFCFGLADLACGKKNLPGQIQNPGDPGRSLSWCTPVPWNAHWHKGRWWSGWSQPRQKCDVGRWAQHGDGSKWTPIHSWDLWMWITH